MLLVSQSQQYQLCLRAAFKAAAWLKEAGKEAAEVVDAFSAEIAKGVGEDPANLKEVTLRVGAGGEGSSWHRDSGYEGGWRLLVAFTLQQ